MNKIISSFCLFLLPVLLLGQNEHPVKFDKSGITHEVVVIDASYQKDMVYTNGQPNAAYSRLKDTVNSLAQRHDKMMLVPVGTLPNFLPYHNNQRGQLSNFLLDMMMATCPTLFKNELHGQPISFAILNFGGIRSQLPSGVVTKLDIYDVLPFDNTPALVRMKGSEVRKIFENFVKLDSKKNEKFLKEEAYSRQVELTYDNFVLTDVKIGGKPLDPEAYYWFVTLDFIALNGGDAILTSSNYSPDKDVHACPTLMRWLLEDYIRNHYN